MSLPFHWVESLAGVRPGDEVTLDGDEAHHAVAVRRLRVGERVMLTDGRGATVLGSIVATGRRRLTVAAEDVTAVPEPAPHMTVVQAVPKGDRGERAVEVLTEIGVGTIVPWAASRSVAVWGGERGERALARWRATAREAAKQARRAWFPEIAELVSTSGVVSLVEASAVSVVLHEHAVLSLADVAVPDDATVVVVVGPEGGLTDEEVSLLRGAGGSVVHLGTEVLRTSTAGVAAVAALLAATRRWR
jgi:16S rRNA (uracil1498-N3)-methyltransferase